MTNKCQSIKLKLNRQKQTQNLIEKNLIFIERQQN